jgi:anti-sigma factor RsiW
MKWLAHRRMRRAVSAYLDGELDGAAAEAVSAHLRECWACSGDAELMRMVKKSLRDLASRHRDALTVMRLRRGTHGAR